MRVNNVLGELGYYLAKETWVYAQFSMEGQVVFQDPDVAIACGVIPLYSTEEILNAQDRAYYGADTSDPEELLTRQLSVPALLTAVPVTITPTVTATPGPTGWWRRRARSRTSTCCA